MCCGNNDMLACNSRKSRQLALAASCFKAGGAELACACLSILLPLTCPMLYGAYCRWCPDLRAVKLHTADPDERKRLRKEVREQRG